MSFSLLHRDDSYVQVLIINASCCIPGVAPFEEQTRRIIEQAISETGVSAKVIAMPATTAYFGGIPKDVMTDLMANANRGQLKVPVVLIDGKPALYGLPKIEDIKSALIQAGETRKIKGGQSHEYKT